MSPAERKLPCLLSFPMIGESTCLIFLYLLSGGMKYRGHSLTISKQYLIIGQHEAIKMYLSYWKYYIFKINHF